MNVAPTLAQVNAYLGTDDRDDPAHVEHALSVAVELVDDFISSAIKEVPDSVYQEAVMTTAKNVWSRRNNIGGGSGPTGEYGPVPQANDPMQKSYQMLRRYVLPF